MNKRQAIATVLIVTLVIVIIGLIAFFVVRSRSDSPGTAPTTPPTIPPAIPPRIPPAIPPRIPPAIPPSIPVIPPSVSPPTAPIPTPPPAPPPMDPSLVYYGDIIQLRSVYNNLLLSTCGFVRYGCNSYNATLRTDDTNLSTKHWKIFPPTGIIPSTRTLVKYGDQFMLRSMYEYENWLFVCSATDDDCGPNVAVGNQHRNDRLRIWITRGADGSNKFVGRNLYLNDVIQLYNLDHNLGLSACGHFASEGNCGVNVSLRLNNNDPDARLWSVELVTRDNV